MFEELRWRKTTTSNGFEQHVKQTSVSLETSLKNWKQLQTKLPKQISKSNFNQFWATFKTRQLFARDIPQQLKTNTNKLQNETSNKNLKQNFNRFYVLLWIWGDLFDFEVRFCTLRLDFGFLGDVRIWAWILIWASTTNVISRISNCDKSFGGVWLTNSSQMSESCMCLGAKVAKGGHLGRVG